VAPNSRQRSKPSARSTKGNAAAKGRQRTAARSTSARAERDDRRTASPGSRPVRTSRKPSGDGGNGQGRRRPSSDAEKFVAAKKRERAVRQRTRMLRRIAALAIVLAFIGVLAWGFVAFINWSVFDIDRVVLNGSTRVNVAAVSGVMGDSVETTVLRANKRDIASGVLRHPWVAEVEVHKRLPATIALDIVERTPLARVADSTGAEWLVSTSGHWLGLWDGEGQVADPEGASAPVNFDASSLVLVEGVPGLEPKADRRTDSPEVLNAVAVLNGLTADLSERIVSVTAIDITGTRIYTESGVEILVGDAERIEAKSKLAMSLLTAKEGTIALIDVRSTKPIWRGLDKP